MYRLCGIYKTGVSESEVFAKYLRRARLRRKVRRPFDTASPVRTKLCSPLFVMQRCALGRYDSFAGYRPDAGGDIVLYMTQLNLSARAYPHTQSVKLARTIADLAACEEIGCVYLAQALHPVRVVPS
jgi:predicted ATPase with chaperone activity